MNIHRNSHTPEERHAYWKKRIALKLASYVPKMQSDYKDIINMMDHLGIDEQQISLAAQQIDWGWNRLAKLLEESKPLEEKQDERPTD